MKTFSYIFIGLILLLLLPSEISKAQINNININKDKDTTKAVNPPPLAHVQPSVEEEPAHEPTKPATSDDEHAIVGVRCMPTFSSLNFQDSGSNKIKGEFVVSSRCGALLGANYANNVGLQMDCIDNNLSQKYKNINLERKIEINYINIPFLLSLNTDRIKSVNLNIVAGNPLGINIGSTIHKAGS